MVRDVKTSKPCKIPIHITMKDGSTKESLSPCLLPNIDSIATIETKSADFFKVVLNFNQIRSFGKIQTVINIVRGQEEKLSNIKT